MANITHQKERNLVKEQDPSFQKYSSLISALRIAQATGFEYRELGNQAVIPLLEGLLDILLQLKSCCLEDQIRMSESMNQELVEKEDLEAFRKLETNQPTKFVSVGRKSIPVTSDCDPLAEAFEKLAEWVSHLLAGLYKPKFDIAKFCTEQNRALFEAHRLIQNWEHEALTAKFGHYYGPTISVSKATENRCKRLTFWAAFVLPAERKKLEEWCSHVDGIERRERQRSTRESARISSSSKMSQAPSSPQYKCGRREQKDLTFSSREVSSLFTLFEKVIRQSRRFIK